MTFALPSTLWESQTLYYIFIIAQLWLTSHQRNIVALLDTGTPGTSTEIYSEDADGETRPFQVFHNCPFEYFLFS